jgi:hypothetical protein
VTSTTVPRRPVPLSMTERQDQVLSDGHVLLHPFTLAELSAVTLAPEAVPPGERGAFLQQVPVIPAPAGFAGVALASAGRSLAADAIGALRRAGFVRLGWSSQPASSAADGLNGWLANPADSQVRQPVTLLGDLAIITRMRAQPVWLAQVSIAPEPANPDPQSARWTLIAQMYGAFRPAIRLIERPARADGILPAFTALREDQALPVLLGLCGADALRYQDVRQRPGPQAGAPLSGDRASGVTVNEMPTTVIANDFGRLALLRVMLADGQRVLVRNLLVASAGPDTWLLDEHGEHAMKVSVAGLADRMASMLSAPAESPSRGSQRAEQRKDLENLG